MADSDLENTSDIEAAVLKRLTSWQDPSSSSPSPPPWSPASPPSIPKRNSSVKKPRRNTRRQRPSEPNDDEIKSFQRSLAASVTDVTKRVLERTIIRPRTPHATTSQPPAKPHTYNTSPKQPLVMKARELRPNRKRREQSDLGSISQAAGPRAKALKDDKGLDAAEFVDSHRREVGRFGSQALHKRDRKTFEAAELVRLGCRSPKRQKVPIGLLVRKREKQKSRDAKKKEMDLASGMLVRSKRR